MVYKVCKGGVRSGNTLRGLNTLKTNRYGRHACLIGRSSLSGRGVDKLVGDSTDDPLVKDALSSTDVFLSLNKRQRWLLPATLRHMITSGSFTSKAMVSLLEKHKLKRRANCVNFVSNKGRLRSVKPTQKRYFSLNTDQIDSDLSKRQQKKQRAEEMRKAVKTTDKERKHGIKTIHTFTKSGADVEPKSVKEPSFISTKPEYRLEVFYPCPKSCSLTFNPKYTDVEIEVNENGDQEIRSVVGNQRAKRSHRRTKMGWATSQWTDTIDDVIEQDVDDMWEETQHEETEEDVPEIDAQKIQQSTRENLFASLISQAEKIRHLGPDGMKMSKSKISKERRTRGSSFTDDDKEKRKLVYTMRDQALGDTKSKESLSKATSNSEIHFNKEIEENKLTFSKVILPSKECSPQYLREKFGRSYAEAESEPRRFLINVTNEVTNILSMVKNVPKSSVYDSFLVFIYEGIYDDGLNVYRVSFNSNVSFDGQCASRISESLTFNVSSFDNILNQILGTLLDLKMEGHLKDHCILHTKPHHYYNYLNDKIGVSYDVLYPEREFSRLDLTETEDFNSLLSKTVEEMDVAVFCDICYESVNTSDIESLPGTSLLKCGHVFCEACWQSNVNTKVRDGATKIICPGFDCDVAVGIATLLSIVHVSQVGLMFQRSLEDEVETSLTSKWCPNPNCGRVIKLNVDDLDQSRALDVTCGCGFHLCFACLNEAHWPARCDQAVDYSEKLHAIKAFDETSEDEAEKIPVVPKRKPIIKNVEMEGRLCPKCSRFIYKNGGCPMMRCRCGHSFCWKCMTSAAEGYHNPSTCVPKFDYVNKFTRRIVVHHVNNIVDTDLQEERAQEKKQTTPSGRQRASLYQRALQQRMDESKEDSTKQGRQAFAKKVASVCLKDPAFKREVLSYCGFEVQPQKDSELASISVTHHVTKFLRSCQLKRSGLHHVAEYTFVLAQDIPVSMERSRALRLANDISAYCSYIRSVIGAGQNQDIRQAIRRLVDIQRWAGQAIDSLLITVNKLRATSKPVRDYH